MDESRKQLLQHPTDVINGFQVRPGYYNFNGAFEIPGGVGVNFTVHSFPGDRLHTWCYSITERTNRMRLPVSGGLLHRKYLFDDRVRLKYFRA